MRNYSSSKLKTFTAYNVNCDEYCASITDIGSEIGKALCASLEITMDQYNKACKEICNALPIDDSDASCSEYVTPSECKVLTDWLQFYFAVVRMESSEWSYDNNGAMSFVHVNMNTGLGVVVTYFQC